MRTVNVDLERDAYVVTIGAGALDGLGEVARARVPGARKALVVVDDNLPEGTVARAVSSLEADGFAVRGASVSAVETNKTLATVEGLLVEAERFSMERGDVVIALGGGIVGDVGGFVAASYRRGIAVIQCPTTLLSMVDASVGGKTGVNLLVDGELRKNMVGAFWQPRAVLADTLTLESLPARVFRAGLGECLKHAMISGQGEAMYAEAARVAREGEAIDHGAIAEMIGRNVEAKARVVIGDEREMATGPSGGPSGGRAALNLGHTFAHAIETIEGLSPSNAPGDAPLMHGEAVMVGLVAASSLSVGLGKMSADEAEAVRGRVASLGVSTRLEGLPGNGELIRRMGSDKKASGGRLRLVVPLSGGGVEIVGVDDACVLGNAWDAVRVG